LKQLLIAFLICFCMAMPAQGDDSNKLTVAGELSSGLKRLAGESSDFITTPLQIGNCNICITAGVLGATALAYSYDKDIQHSIKPNQNSKIKSASEAGSLLGDPYIHIGAALLVYGGGIVADSPKWKQTGEMIGEALILADASTLLIKEAAGRGRPDVSRAKGDFKPFGFKTDYDSFPSMHTSSSFAMASVLAATSESYVVKSACYLAASFVGFSRIYRNRHWTSDVLFGAALGELSGRTVTNFHASGKRFAISPISINNGAGLAMVGTW
jgi:membrane-associated phospholipid phosphatase